MTLIGNAVMLLVSHLDNKLHTPIYFFLWKLSFLDICFTTCIVPQILVNIRRCSKKISYIGCMVQCSVALAPGSTECVLLAAMAIDPCVAVCWPILCATIMHPKICHLLAAMSWFSRFTNSLLQSSLAIVLPFCGCCHVDHFLCEVLVIIKLSSVDTVRTELNMLIAHLIILAIPVCIILTSHVCIAMAVVRMHSVEG